MRMRVWTLALVIGIGAAISGSPAAAAATFSDVEGHWVADLVASAAAAGYVNGYPDGTFRPDAPVTRAEALKLVLAAGQVGLIEAADPMWSSSSPDDHWIVRQGYLRTAEVNDIVPFGTDFRPDDPATRLDLLQFVLRMLHAPYNDPPVPAQPPAFTDVRSDEEWRWVHTAVELGLVEGYPDGTFRPDGPVTRAEAVAMVERAVAWMTAGTDPQLRLVVNGEAIPEAQLAVRDGVIYAPAAAIYQDDWTIAWSEVKGPEAYAFARNEQFRTCEIVVRFEAGERSAASGQDAGTTELLGLPYLRFYRLMIPVAPVGGTGKLPFAKAVHDPASGTVTITYTEDWPGYHLPTDPSTVRMTMTGTSEVDPLYRPSSRVGWPRLVDAQGNCVQTRQLPSVTYAVDPADPLRLRGEDGQLVMTYTAGPDNAWKEPEVVVTADEPVEGTYAISVASGDFVPTEWPVVITDRGPRRLVLEASGPLKVGLEANIQILTVDRYDRLSDYGMEAYPGGSIPDPLRVIGPDGSEVEVQPFIYERGTIDAILSNGKGSFTFTPEIPGTYRVLIPWVSDYPKVDGYLEGTFEVSP